ncbi:MAG: hypothetical protein H0V81_08340 [Solirubrobacterales bacterium]|nr:hypothetical protein [Solirubrobacterales bacterium]
MRSTTVAVIFATGLVLALPTTVGAASSSGTYKGKATSLDRDFRFGSVKMKVRGTKVTSLVIKAVTTTGCGNFMDVVFAPSDPETKIILGSAKLKNGRLIVTYRPVADVESQTTSINARVKGGKVTGTFKSGGICNNEGRFTAKR